MTEQQEQQPEPLYNRIKVGDIELVSPFESMDSLIEKVKAMLSDENIKEYLGLVKLNKVNWGACG